MSNALISYLLKMPSYGWGNKETPACPDRNTVFREFWLNYNVFADQKNWMTFLIWTQNFLLLFFTISYFIFWFSWLHFGIAMLYTLVILPSWGTFFLHRFGTHKAFSFRNRFWTHVMRNSVIKLLPAEIYVISHHVHHKFSDKVGDPYNPASGWWACFLADAIHNHVNRNLEEKDYLQAQNMMAHLGVKCNDYKAYQKWGTISSPAFVLFEYILNYAFWGTVFYLLGGWLFVFAIWGTSSLWIFSIRTFNYQAHGGGKDLRKVGRDFNTEDLSLNTSLSRFFAGEWHNNHHLYPTSARSGFLWWQLDIPWYWIWILTHLGIIKVYRDDTKSFMENHYKPYQDTLTKRNK